MPTPNPAALDFLTTRRSRPAKTLAEPGPDREALRPLLTAAARVPDHGKLEPWRFVVAEGAARHRLRDLAQERGAALGMEPEKVAKAAGAFLQGGVVVAVIAAPVASDKIPEAEQLMSAGCVCLGLLNAALSAGWGANWLTGFTATDRPFLEAAFGLAAPAFVAGYIHIGTETVAPPERPRPDIDAITRWLPA
jgi:Nitroreductase